MGPGAPGFDQPRLERHGLTRWLRRAAAAGTFALALACCSQTAVALEAPAPAAGTRLFVPNFWDPSARMEKPDLTTLRSIRFLTEDDYPPFNFMTADGTLVGFNVDLARALCEELKVACTVQARRWDTIVEAITDGRGDAAVASIAITQKAREKLDFTHPYYRTPARFVATNISPLTDATPETLAGKTIGVEAQSAHEAYLRAFFPRSKVKTFDNPTALRAALSGGGVDIIFGDGITLALWLNGTDAAACCAFKGGAYTEARYFGSGVGIAVKKDNANLREALDYALERLAERGIYADLYLKYFPVGFY